MSVVDIDNEDDDKWLDYAASLLPEEKNKFLVKAAEDGETWRCERLIGLGANPAYKEHRALMSAAHEGRAGAVSVLLRHAPPQGALDDALVEAVAGGHAEIVKSLLQAGADAAHEQSVALFFTAQRDRPEIADMLLKAGADPHAHKGTLMCIALSHGHARVAQVFLENGADPNVFYRDMDAFDWSAELGHVEFSKTLRAWAEKTPGASAAFFASKTVAELRAPLPGHKGRSGLHVAASSGQFAAVRDVFLSEGAQLTADDLLAKATHAGPTVLFLLGQTQSLQDAFDARLWAGRRDEMLEAYAQVPGAFRGQIDLPALSSALDRLALKARSSGFSLKP